MPKGTLELRNIRISKGSDALLHVDLTVQAGAIATIMGPSGIGKSTLLSFIGGTLDQCFQLRATLF